MAATVHDLFRRNVRSRLLKIYSKVDPSKLLHFVHTTRDFGERVDLVEPSQILQLSSQRIPAESSFRAHKHLSKQVQIPAIKAQESWVVVSGKVRVSFFDLNDSLISTFDLGPGDASVTLEGGHSYKALEESLVYEFKTGPYLGVDLDKSFI